MADAVTSKVFNYQLDGLSYSINVFTADDGTIQATISVTEGHADFNGAYWGDDEFSGTSESLSGPLNMNGAEGSTFDGETVQWDEAQKLSSPGLGKLGADKPTYLTTGESYTFTLEGATSLDDIEYLGIRATSTSTPSGSIKAIAVPEVPPVDPEDCLDHDGGSHDGAAYPDIPDDTYGVTFHIDVDLDGAYDEYVFIEADPDADPETTTFQDYFDRLVEQLAVDMPDVDPCDVVGKATVYSTTEGESYFHFEVATDGSDVTPFAVDAPAQEDEPLEDAAPADEAEAEQTETMADDTMIASADPFADDSAEDDTAAGELVTNEPTEEVVVVDEVPDETMPEEPVATSEDPGEEEPVDDAAFYQDFVDAFGTVQDDEPLPPEVTEDEEEMAMLM